MDQNSLPPIQTTARDDAVLKALVGFVRAEALQPGDRLPTERILAERLKVSRNTVREALTRWEGLGLVERRQGSGTYLRAAVSPDMLHMPLTLAGGNDFTSLMQTLEIRCALEAEAAALCAERASQADIAEIARKLDVMEQAFRTRDGMSSEEDWEFHQAIYRVSGNPLFEQIISAMHELFHRFWEHPLGVRDFGHASFPYHRTIYERIAARDPQGARAEALKLIATVEDDLKRGAAKLKLSSPDMNEHPSGFDHDYLAEAATLLAHDEPFPGGAVVPPIYQTSLFTFANYAEMADTFAGKRKQPIYSRGDNPTVMEFEARVAALEGAEAARGFSSGMAAISATVLAFVGAGERIVAVRNCYGDAYRLFERLLPRLNIKVDYVDGSDPDAVAAALPGARLLYLESPTSMMFELQDISALTRLAREQGIVTTIDNSWATPVFQKPITHGVDLVLHSASKYLGGHSDTVAGVVAGSAAHIKHINEQTYSYLGGKLSPFEAWLLLRGLRTLPLRLPHHMKSGLTIAERLKAHANVERVNHPAYSNHPGKATLAGYAGLFSFEVTDDIDIPVFVDALKYFRIGVSWGGHESLVVPAKASLEQTPGLNSMARFGVSPRTIRFNVGLESVEDLWADVAQAFEKARK